MSEKPFIFVASKGWRGGMNDRGGLQFLLKAFTEEFKEDESVELRVKVNLAYWNPNQDFGKALEEIGIPKHKNLRFMLQNVESKQLKELYKGDVFITTSMSDAFNIPPLEAMSCGLPCIATNYGGHTDFITTENGFLINGEMVDVTWDLAHEGNKWLKPDINEIRRVMRHLVTYPGLVQERKNKAIETAQKFTWRSSAKRLLELVK